MRWYVWRLIALYLLIHVDTLLSASVRRVTQYVPLEKLEQPGRLPVYRRIHARRC